MTYDDVADIKAMLGAITALLERMANTLERIESDTTIIEANVDDIAEFAMHVVTLTQDPPEPPE